MKKVVSLMIIFALLLTLTACAGNAKPDTVVTSFCNAMQKFDSVAMASYTQEGSDVQSPLDDSDELTSQIIDYLTTSASEMKYSIEKSEIINDTAKVTVKYSFVDLSPIVTATLGEYFQQAIAMSLGGADEETITQLFGTIFKEKIESVSAGTAETTVEFECVKSDNEWKIKAVPDDALNVLTCNMYSAFDSFSNDFEEITNDEDTAEVEEEDYVWADIPFGEEVELATIRIRLTDVTEDTQLNSSYSDTSAQEGTKFVIITAEIENITKSPLSFNNDLPLCDDQGRSYNPYEDAFWYVDNSFSYVELAPSITQTGAMIYVVPEDAVGYYLTVIKAGTNEAYRLLTD